MMHPPPSVPRPLPLPLSRSLYLSVALSLPHPYCLIWQCCSLPESMQGEIILPDWRANLKCQLFLCKRSNGYFWLRGAKVEMCFPCVCVCLRVCVCVYLCMLVCMAIAWLQCKTSFPLSSISCLFLLTKQTHHDSGCELMYLHVNTPGRNPIQR